MYKRILVPLDGSRLAEAPLRYAVWLAKKTGAELVLMHVFGGRVSDKWSYLQKQAEDISQQLQVEGGPPANVKLVDVSGDPASLIIEYANENQVDLIAMSTHGHTGIRHWLLGSVADKVVNYSMKPIWLVKSFEDLPADEEFDRKILVLLDGSEIAEKILPFATYHAKLAQGELVLLHICEPPQIIPAGVYHMIPQGYPPTLPLEWEQYVEREIERRSKECRLYLGKFMDKEDNSGIKTGYEYLFGKAVEEIEIYLKTVPVSLVAMTTRGSTGLARRVIGSVAEKVISVARSPVLIMRPAQ